MITQHIQQEYVDEANHIRHYSYVKSVYSRRKETIERVFADCKEKHGMRYTHLRGIAKIKMEAMLTFSCANLKKIANHLWKRKGRYRCDSCCYSLYLNFQLKIMINILKSIFSITKKCFLSTISGYDNSLLSQPIFIHIPS